VKISKIGRILLVLLLIGCGKQPIGRSFKPNPTTGTTIGSSVKHVSKESSKDLFPEYYAPVLLQEGLEEVRLSLESRDDELASLALTERLGKAEPKEPERTRLYYLLGVIEERLGNVVRAKNAFREATMTTGPLQLDAWLHLTRLAETQKDCGGLSQIRQEIEAMDPSLREVTLLDAEIANCQGRREDTLRAYRAVIATAKPTLLKAYYQVRLAEILSQTMSGCTERQRDVDDELAELIAQVKAVAGTNELLSKKLGQVVARVTCPQFFSLPSGLRAESFSYVDELFELRRWDESKQLLSEWEGEVGTEPAHSETLCKIQFYQGRVAAASGKPVEAIERFEWVVAHCSDADLSARALYLGAAQFSKTGKLAEAITHYAEIERRFKEHRLADDARLKTALLYRSLGSEKQYLELLEGMADQYPAADMTQEGLFLVALEAMLRKDWGAAITKLRQAQRIAESSGVIRDVERERLTYFLARAQMSLGEVDVAIPSLQSLVASRPFSYYMLLSDAVLRERSVELATTAIAQGTRVASSQPTELSVDIAARDRETRRVMALLSVGDLAFAAERMLALSNPENGRESFWAMVGLYVDAGAIDTAITMAKSRTDDYRIRWPVGNWVKLWTMAYPVPYEPLVTRESTKTAAPTSLIYAVMREESEFNPSAVSPANAYGLMQLIVPTAVHAARGTGTKVSPSTLLKPATNIFLGARVLGKLLERFRGQMPLAIAGYNAGPGRPVRWLKERPEAPMDLWVEAIEYTETRNYVKRVLASQATYRWLYGAPAERGTVDPLNLKLIGP
jgi:soluble lytic murein transglycosylase